MRRKLKMAALSKTYNEKDLLNYFKYLRLTTAKELNDKNVEETKPIVEEKKTFGGITKNAFNSIKQKVYGYDKKETKIDSDLSSVKTKYPNMMSKGEAIDLCSNLFIGDDAELSKLVLGCTVILDNEFDYKYEEEGLAEVSNVIYNDKNTLLVIKKDLEKNYNAISPTSLTSVQKGVLVGVAITSLASLVCMPVLLAGGSAVSGATTTAALAAHGFGDMQIGIGMLTLESVLISAAFTGLTYGTMKLYNSEKVRREFKKLDSQKNALYLAIQMTYIQRISKILPDEELKEKLDTLLKNLGTLKSDLDYFLFVEKECTKENKEKIKSFHEFDDRLIKILDL